MFSAYNTRLGQLLGKDPIQSRRLVKELIYQKTLSNIKLGNKLYKIRIN